MKNQSNDKLQQIQQIHLTVDSIHNLCVTAQAHPILSSLGFPFQASPQGF